MWEKIAFPLLFYSELALVLPLFVREISVNHSQGRRENYFFSVMFILRYFYATLLQEKRS